ncbi:RNA 2',3'-cyclic phosphodiesterase [Nocardiopsis sp. HNM0947]|uniref:RNA 2',3'-cyclic phosphodiesterase n=1 Tax=Nocardiopsis coralli TaxID=2772213 RepID=A0ABR9PBA6_9ACTN|nr:RNA 2',3'-cyclic phosphodiesterase [Nocardiopsis coralli]MBE3001117.1 RNA 2',3'-cyclic phosphodiesterase [Nocardiopsis coralli]
MRLFTALALPTHAVDALRDAVRRGRRHEPRLRWVAPEHWHLTLVYLGDVGPDHLAVLGPALQRAAAAHPPLDLELDGWGTFPQQGAGASVLWAGVGGDTQGLADLVGDLRRAAREAGVETDARPYVPHITVARSRPPRDLGATVEELGNLPHLGWSASRADLVESVPGSGTRYRTALTCPLLWGTDNGRSPERGTS